jgi:hypothetical protein
MMEWSRSANPKKAIQQLELAGNVAMVASH